MHSSPQDWEQCLSADLMPYLVPAGQPSRAQRPLDVTSLPPGAYRALGDAIGRYGLEDLLIVPASAWPCGGLRRRCLYAPLCVLGTGERAAGLWVQALPEPGVRVVVPVSQIAVIEHVADGPRRLLAITGHDGPFVVRYGATGDGPADALARRLRWRAARSPGPVPGGSAGRGLLRPRPWRPHPGPPELSLDGGQIAVTGRRSPATGREILVAVTSRELVVGTGVRSAGQFRTLYIPRDHLEQASVQAGLLRLRSAGTEVTVALRSRRVAAVAASWLTELTGCHHISADS